MKSIRPTPGDGEEKIEFRGTKDGDAHLCTKTILPPLTNVNFRLNEFSSDWPEIACISMPRL